MPKVILISGCKRCGKDTVANRLMAMIPNSGKFCFADPLRDVCSIMFGFTPEHSGDDLKDVPHPDWGFSPRDALIKVGTELMRKQIDPDIWVKATLRRMKEATFDYIFVTDARFLNEIDMVKSAFPDHINVLIIRPSVIPAGGTDGAHVTEHFSIEQSIETTYPFHSVYVNHNLDDVEKCVNDLYASLIALEG